MAESAQKIAFLFSCVKKIRKIAGNCPCSASKCEKWRKSGAKCSFYRSFLRETRRKSQSRVARVADVAEGRVVKSN